MKSLASGRYKVTAAKMTHHGATAKPAQRSWQVDVTGQRGAAVQVTFARVPGAVERVSTTSRDKQANGQADGALWSPDGTRIAFTSWASNLVPGDADKKGKLPDGDLFVKHLTTGKTTLMSAADISGTRWVSRTRLAFFAYSQKDKRTLGVVRDLRTGRTWTAPLPRGATPWAWSPK